MNKTMIIFLLFAGLSCMGYDEQLQNKPAGNRSDASIQEIQLDSVLQKKIDSIEPILIKFFEARNKLRSANDKITAAEAEKKSVLQALEKASAVLQKEFIKLGSLPGVARSLSSSSGRIKDSTALVGSMREGDSLLLQQKTTLDQLKAADTSKKEMLKALNAQKAGIEEKLHASKSMQWKLWSKYLGQDTTFVRKNDTLLLAVNRVQNASRVLYGWQAQLNLLDKKLENGAAEKNTFGTEIGVFSEKLSSAVRLFDSAYAVDTGKVFFAFRFHGKYYRLFLASSSRHRIDIYASFKKPASQQPLSVSWDRMIKEKKTPLMVMNGGMYQEDGSPVGLYISGGLIRKPLNLDSGAKQDNFHLYPNGVFAVDTLGRFHVEQSEMFSKTLKRSQGGFRYATQSGPMLVVADSIHPSFNFVSGNVNIRNGVGVIEGTHNARAVFLISESEVNFFDMALLMKYVFRCRDALYLDGFVSRMYYDDGNEKYGDKGGTLGPVIAISKK